MKQVFVLLKFLLLFLLVSFAGTAAADSRFQVREVESILARTGVTSMHVLEDFFPSGGAALLVFYQRKKKIEVYQFREGKLARITYEFPHAKLTHAVTFRRGEKRRVALGFEHGKGEDDRISVAEYDRELNEVTKIFDEKVRMGFITHLSSVPGGLFLNYLEGMPDTKAGFLRFRADGTWYFQKIVFGHLLLHFDISGKEIAAGGPERLEARQTAELRLYRNGVWSDLPSDRGVSAVRFVQLDSDPEEELLIADGIPNKRAKGLSPQLALVQYESSKGEFVRKELDRLSSVHAAIDKIEPLTLGKRKVILTRTSQSIFLYEPDENWRRERLYRRRKDSLDEKIDFAPLESSAHGFVFAILDAGEVRIFTAGKHAYKKIEVSTPMPTPEPKSSIKLAHYLSYDAGSDLSAEQRLDEFVVWGTGLDLSKVEETVRDKDLAQLDDSAFQDVKWLNLRGTAVTDEGLRYVKRLSNLRTLILEDTNIRGYGLKYLHGLPLEVLVLENTPIDDRGLKNLVGLSIKALDLTNTSVTDEGLPTLSALPLQVLDLYSTRVTDAGLIYLAEYATRLRRLYLTGTLITVGALEEFRLKYPDVYIIY